MPSNPDTFAEVVRKLRAHVTAHYSTKDTSTAFLTDVLEAARLLAAAGEEVRAWNEMVALCPVCLDAEKPIPAMPASVREELTTLRQRAEAAEKQLAEAKRYGAPVDAVALSFVNDPCTKHNAYWTTSSGACMACRAEAAERRVRELEGAVKIMGTECLQWRWGKVIDRISLIDAPIRRAVCCTDANPIAKAAIDAAGGEG